MTITKISSIIVSEEEVEMNCDSKIMERYTTVRKNQGLSIRKFAEVLGVSNGVVSNIEYKKLEKVSDLYINLLCDKLDVNEHWLRTGEGEMYKAYPRVSEHLKEITNIFDELTPELQECAALQVKNLLEYQNKLFKFSKAEQVHKEV